MSAYKLQSMNLNIIPFCDHKQTQATVSTRNKVSRKEVNSHTHILHLIIAKIHPMTMGVPRINSHKALPEQRIRYFLMCYLYDSPFRSGWMSITKYVGPLGAACIIWRGGQWSRWTHRGSLL